MASKESARVCLYGDHLAAAYQEFCRTVWPSSTRDLSASLSSGAIVPPSDGSAAPIFLFMKNDKVVGHVASVPVRLSMSSGVLPAHWIVGFMVLPEFRSGLVGPLIIKEVNRVLDCAMSLHVEPPVLRILTGLKWVHKGVLPQYLCVLRARSVLDNLQPSVAEAVHSQKNRSSLLRTLLRNSSIRGIGSGSLALGQSIWSAVTIPARHSPMKAEVCREETFDDSYTDLWQSVSGQFGASLVRDTMALQARYGPKMKSYQLLACRRGKTLLGYCILKMKQFSQDARMGNMHVGTIVDCLYDPRQPATLQALFNEALRWFRQEDTHVVLCTASLTSIRQVLVRNGFFKIPGNLNFAYHSRSSTEIGTIPLEAWHLMRGDSDADQNF